MGRGCGSPDTNESSPVNPEMATTACFYPVVASLLTSSSKERLPSPSNFSLRFQHRVHPSLRFQTLSTRPGYYLAPQRCRFSVACLPSTTSESDPIDPTKLYISGLSFRTTEESLRNAFQNYGQLVEVNLVMDRIANRPRGYAFLRYSTEEESKKAIDGMHGKFLDGRVIFVEICKPRSAVRQRARRRPLQY